MGWEWRGLQLPYLLDVLHIALHLDQTACEPPPVQFLPQVHLEWQPKRPGLVGWLRKDTDGGGGG